MAYPSFAVIRYTGSGFPGSVIASLLGALLLVPTQAWSADQKLLRIGVTKIVSHAALDADEKGFEAALASAGFKEGVNVRYDRQNAQGDTAKAAAIAQKFEADKVDLVHSIATPTSQAAVRAIRTIPVVFSSISDPIGAAVVPQDSAPGKKTGTNVTGVSDL